MLFLEFSLKYLPEKKTTKNKKMNVDNETFFSFITTPEILRDLRRISCLSYVQCLPGWCFEHAKLKKEPSNNKHTELFKESSLSQASDQKAFFTNNNYERIYLETQMEQAIIKRWCEASPSRLLSRRLNWIVHKQLITVACTFEKLFYFFVVVERKN